MIRFPRSPLTIAATCAALYAGVIGGTGALAQEATPTATATPASTSTPVKSSTPAGTPTPKSTPKSTQTVQPAATPEDVPPENSTPYPTPDNSTPTPTPTPAKPGANKPSKGGNGGKPKPAKGGKGKSGKGKGKSGKGGKGKSGKGGKNSKGKNGGCKGSGSSKGRGCEKQRQRNRQRNGGSAPTPVAPTGPVQRSDGTPTPAHPGYTQATPGAAPLGVPNFFIEKFRIPPFLLPIYQAAGMEYGIRWEILAAINEIETDYGRNLNVSSAGALGWMQFMPATWKAYGTDANKDGVADPYNPVDAIFSAARYLKAAGAEQDLYKAIFAYNHADWYVQSVLMRARLIGGLPSNFVGSLTGLTQARFPVYAKSTYAGDLSKSQRKGRNARAGTNAAFTVESDAERRDIEIFARNGSSVIAVNDAKVTKMGHTKELGRHIEIQDVYGNTFTYARLGSLAETYPVPRARRSKPARGLGLDSLPRDAAPTRPASSTARSGTGAKRPPAAKRKRAAAAKRKRVAAPKPSPVSAPIAGPTKERLFANPTRPKARAAGGAKQLEEQRASRTARTFEFESGSPLKINRTDYDARPLRKGARVIAGTVLGRIGAEVEGKAPHVLFEIRPAGRGAPRIDPKPILDGWKLLESTAIYRAAGKNPFFGADAKRPSIGQILLMSKEALQRRVLSNPRIGIYPCGRQDVRTGAIDRRVLASLEFLAASGLRPTVSSLRCGRAGVYTKSGSVSHHVTGNAVDIAAINGVTISPRTQGKGSITDHTVQRLLTLQGTMKPDQIITLMKYEGTDNTFAMSDHHDHIHIGWRPLYADAKEAKRLNAVLAPKQWIKLVDRLNQIENPEVAKTPSKYALKVVKRASRAHRGE